MLSKVKCDKADAERKLASLNLMETILSEFPVGLICYIELGGHILKVEITGHASYWWSGPGHIFGRNVKTGNNRKFHYSDIIL